jgi:Tripartite tricarboxylate transporter TctB family
MVGSNRYGPLVLVGTMLALGVAYLVSTTTADSPSEAKLFPLACGVLFVVLLAWEGISLLAKGAPAPDPHAAQAARAADEGLLLEDVAAPADAAPEEDAEAAEPGRVARFVGLIVLMVVFAYLASEVDYVLATALFTAVSMWLIAPDRAGWKSVAAVTVGSVIAVNLIFVQLLSISLPSLIGL